MAKIKFNLNFGGEQIRTLDDLRDNFSIEDILDVYNNGLLVKWLDVRNHKNELAKVKAIQATDARSILSELIQIFGVTSDEAEIQESLSILDYLEGRKKFWADIKAGKFDEIARNLTKIQNEKDIHNDYNALVQNIIAHPDDLQYIYDQLDAIAVDYPDLLKTNATELYKNLYNKAPLAILAFFGNSATRPYVEHESNLELGDVIRQIIYTTTSSINKINGFRTNSRAWHTIEPAGKKFLLLACYRHWTNDMYFSDADNNTRKIRGNYQTPLLSPSLPIVNGISAEEFSDSDILWYMEAR